MATAQQKYFNFLLKIIVQSLKYLSIHVSNAKNKDSENKMQFIKTITHQALLLDYCYW